MSNHSKKAVAVIAGLWILLSVVTLADAQPTAAPAAMRPAATAPAAMPAPRPAPRRVAPMPAPKRAAPKPAAMPAPMPAAMVPAAAMPAPAMAPAPAAPVMAATEPAMAPVPDKKVDAKAKKDGKGSVIGGWALQIVLYLLGAFLAAFIPVFTAWLYKKFKITNLEHKDSVDGMVLKAAMFGIGKAEEAAYKLRDNPMDSAKKLDVAIKGANQYLVDSGLPEKGSAYLAALIESQLGLARTDEEKKSAPKAKDKPEEKKDEKKDEAKESDDK